MNGSSVMVVCREQAGILESCLLAALVPVAAKGIAFEAERFPRGSSTVFRLVPAAGRRSQETVKALRSAAAAGVADFMLGHHLPARLRRLAERCYPDLEPADLDAVAAEARHVLVGGVAGEAARDLRAALEDWFSRHPEVAVEGYVRFRLGDLLAESGEALHRAARRLLGQREEAGFLAAVRAGLERADRRLGRAHVQRLGEAYLLLGEGGPPPDLPAGLGLVPEAGGVRGDEDGLLAALFWLNPGCIVLHGPDLPADCRRVLDTAFPGRVVACDCCGGPAARAGRSARSPEGGHRSG